MSHPVAPTTAGLTENRNRCGFLLAPDRSLSPFSRTPDDVKFHEVGGPSHSQGGPSDDPDDISVLDKFFLDQSLLGEAHQILDAFHFTD
jgi:hypothetical protein